MKKIIIIIVSILLFLILIGIIIYNNDNLKFKFSYEYLNYVEDSNGKIVKVKIPIDNKVKYINETKLIDLLNNGTGVIYIGSNSCPWCRSVIGPLIKSIKESNISTLYYYDSNKGFKNGKVIKDLLKDFLLEEDGKKKMATPTVIFIKNGKIKDVVISGNDIFDYPYKKLTDNQKQELIDLYKSRIELIK